LTAEESSVIGGLNSLVSQAIAGKYLGPVIRIGIEDRFGYSSLNYEDLLESFGFTYEKIAEKVTKALNI
jgi:transketolase